MIYINDFSDDLTANVKLFSDDPSLFSIVCNMYKPTIKWKSDLSKISNYAIYWKINFNPNPSKLAQEVTFSRKLQKTNHYPVYFNHNSVEQVPSLKHLGMYLDTRLNF